MLVDRIKLFCAAVGADIKALRTRIVNCESNLKEATKSAPGLMSAADKEKLDGLAAGGGVPTWTSEGRPKSGVVRFGFNTTWGGLEYWNGAAWIRLQGERAYSTTFGNGRFGNKF